MFFLASALEMFGVHSSFLIVCLQWSGCRFLGNAPFLDLDLGDTLRPDRKVYSQQPRQIVN